MASNMASTRRRLPLRPLKKTDIGSATDPRPVPCHTHLLHEGTASRKEALEPRGASPPPRLTKRRAPPPPSPTSSPAVYVRPAPPPPSTKPPLLFHDIEEASEGGDVGRLSLPTCLPSASWRLDDAETRDAVVPSHDMGAAIPDDDDTGHKGMPLQFVRDAKLKQEDPERMFGSRRDVAASSVPEGVVLRTKKSSAWPDETPATPGEESCDEVFHDDLVQTTTTTTRPDDVRCQSLSTYEAALAALDEAISAHSLESTESEEGAGTVELPARPPVGAAITVDPPARPPVDAAMTVDAPARPPVGAAITVDPPARPPVTCPPHRTEDPDDVTAANHVAKIPPVTSSRHGTPVPAPRRLAPAITSTSTIPPPSSRSVVTPDRTKPPTPVTRKAVGLGRRELGSPPSTTLDNLETATTGHEASSLVNRCLRETEDSDGEVTDQLKSETTGETSATKSGDKCERTVKEPSATKSGDKCERTVKEPSATKSEYKCETLDGQKLTSAATSVDAQWLHENEEGVSDQVARSVDVRRDGTPVAWELLQRGVSEDGAERGTVGRQDDATLGRSVAETGDEASKGEKLNWDPRRCFTLDDVEDPEMRLLFENAGVTDEELRDADTRRFIHRFLVNHGGMEAVRREAHFKATLRLVKRKPRTQAPRRDHDTRL